MEIDIEKGKRQVEEIRRELILIENIVGNALPQHHPKTMAGKEVTFSSNMLYQLGFLYFLPQGFTDLNITYSSLLGRSVLFLVVDLRGHIQFAILAFSWTQISVPNNLDLIPGFFFGALDSAYHEESKSSH